MNKLRNRLITIGLCVLASVWALFPRTVIERVNRGGEFVYDTVQRVPLKKGLDLAGGMHLALEIDDSETQVADRAEALDRAVKVVRNRVDQFGVTEPIVQKGDDRIIVELPGLDDPERAQSIVEEQAYLQFQITDKTQAFERIAGRLDGILRQRGFTAPSTGGAQGGTKSLFATADSVTTDSAATDSASAPGGGPFSTRVRPTGTPGIYTVDAADFPLLERALADSAVQQAMPPGKVIRWGADSAQSPFRTLYVLDAIPIITGDYLVDARPVQDPMEGTLVTFELNNEGGRRFGQQTARHVGDFMAIVLDDRVMTAPVIQSTIRTRGQITLGRGRNIAEAQDLALVLRAGALPVPLRVAEVRTIGPSLGQDSIDAGVRAGMISIALVVLVMSLYYRFSGVLAVTALALYVLFTLAILAGFEATLTLPGLAGFVLSVGIAVDANILIFERIREEIVAGKTVRLAIEEGFRHAMSAIVDSNVSTALTAAVLYQFGSGPVRGFAVTLLAGIAASLFCAIFVVRTFYYIYLSRRSEAQALSI